MLFTAAHSASMAINAQSRIFLKISTPPPPPPPPNIDKEILVKTKKTKDFFGIFVFAKGVHKAY